MAMTRRGSSNGIVKALGPFLFFLLILFIGLQTGFFVTSFIPFSTGYWFVDATVTWLIVGIIVYALIIWRRTRRYTHLRRG
jgi:hypothetical protein